MSEQEVYLENRSYKKILYHSLKYQTKDTIGILVAEKENNLTIISNIFPLCHLRVTLALLETGFNLIEAQLKPNQFICGIYESLPVDRSHSDNVSLSSRKILTSIQQQLQKDPLLIKFREVDNKLKIQCMQFHNNVVSEVKKEIRKDQPQLQSEILNDLQNSLHLKVIDLEEHLEEPNLDFTNKHLN